MSRRAIANRPKSFQLNVNNALTPDPGKEGLLKVKNNPFAFTSSYLTKLLNPKGLDAFYALGGLEGLEKGLHTNRDSGLSADEKNVDSTVTFKDVAPQGTPQYGQHGAPSHRLLTPSDSSS
ncbi:plasma membrane calcium [Neurospora sp. IMI 360204]|nr:plasma membrane calcium [Neurospora sp. IMI 360204]